MPGGDTPRSASPAGHSCSVPAGRKWASTVTSFTACTVQGMPPSQPNQPNSLVRQPLAGSPRRRSVLPDATSAEQSRGQLIAPAGSLTTRPWPTIVTVTVTVAGMDDAAGPTARTTSTARSATVAARTPPDHRSRVPPQLPSGRAARTRPPPRALIRAWHGPRTLSTGAAAGSRPGRGTHGPAYPSAKVTLTVAEISCLPGSIGVDASAA